MMVAIGVLGIGLTMVACFFPVAMYQHADTVSQQNAMRIAREAKNLVLTTPTPMTLVEPGVPQEWQSTAEYRPDNLWVEMISRPENPTLPAFDAEVRYVWYLFVRWQGAVRQHLVVVTRRLPGQLYHVDQALPMPWWPASPPPDNLPQPWILQLKAGSVPRSLAPDEALPAPARELFPPNTKLIGNRTGLVYTVIDVDGVGNIMLREVLDPHDDPAAVGASLPFIWFPPAVGSGESPYVAGLFF